MAVDLPLFVPYAETLQAGNNRLSLNDLLSHDGVPSRFVYCDSGRPVQRKWARMGL